MSRPRSPRRGAGGGPHLSPAPAHTGAGPERARDGEMGFGPSEETKDTQTWETARGQRGPEWRRRARGGDQTKGRTLTGMPAPGPAPPQRGPTRRVPGQQVHVLCWERHTCERRPSRPGSPRGRPASRPAGGADSWPGQRSGRGARAGPRPERSWEQGMCVSPRPGQPHCSPDPPASAPSAPHLAPLPHWAVPRPSPAPRGKARSKVC